MKIDGGLGVKSDISKVKESARQQEAQGYEGLWVPEATHDPFIPLALAADSTESVDLGTSIVVAFARNPMSLAYSANDLQLLSKGRFILGLGSQIKPHITRRFSMEWSRPAARMREMIAALKAIWNTWNTGEKLDFRGDFYQHTLMTPFFDPGVNPHGAPKIAVAGVGELMTQVAGETADVFLSHSFSTEKYLREVTIPNLEKGALKAGRSLDDIEITAPGFIVTGDTDEEMETAANGTRQQIAFYASTPAYRCVLETHGWGDLQTELNAMSKQSQWGPMGELITDEILEAFAIVGPPESIPAEVHKRYGDVTHRISFYAPYKSDPDRWRSIFDGIKRGDQ